MGRRDPTEAVIGATVATLRATAGVTALVATRVYNNVPQGTVYPYVEVTTPTANRRDTFGRSGQQTLVDVKAITQTDGDLQGFRIRDQVTRGLDAQKPAAVGHTILGIAWELNEQLEEFISGIRTRSHIATFRIWSEQSSS